jgi:curli biogenesis system outer membrane secretion channel CsgG
MKRFLAALILVVVAVPALAAAQDEPTGGLRYTISVSQFQNRSGWHGQWDLGHAWSTILTDVLQQTGYFIVLGETDMRNEALAEQEFAASGRTAQGSKAPPMGEMTPAQLLVKGAITHVEEWTKGGRGKVRISGVRVGGKVSQAEINATIYVVDSTTGQVVASTDLVGRSNRTSASIGYASWDWGAELGGFKNDNVGKATEAAISDAVEWLIVQIPGQPWSGSVALVKDGKVYVNRGAREGVQSGQSFLVGESDVIRDPETGEVLDERLSEVARLEVEIVEEKLSICAVTSGDLASIERGMRIQLP